MYYVYLSLCHISQHELPAEATESFHRSTYPLKALFILRLKALHFLKTHRSTCSLSHASTQQLTSYTLTSTFPTGHNLQAWLTVPLLAFVLHFIVVTWSRWWCRGKSRWGRIVQCVAVAWSVCAGTLWYSAEPLSFFCSLCVIHLTTNLISCRGYNGLNYFLCKYTTWWPSR